MSRFTENSEFYKYVLPKENEVGETNLQEYYLSVGEYTIKPYYVGKAVDKLFDLENVLEEFGIESAEELKAQLKQSQNSKAIEVLEDIIKTCNLAKEFCGAKVTALDIASANVYNRCIDDIKTIINNKITELRGGESNG